VVSRAFSSVSVRQLVPIPRSRWPDLRLVLASEQKSNLYNNAVVDPPGGGRVSAVAAPWPADPMRQRPERERCCQWPLSIVSSSSCRLAAGWGDAEDLVLVRPTASQPAHDAACLLAL
jgi:hypothetical protein